LIAAVYRGRHNPPESTFGRQSGFFRRRRGVFGFAQEFLTEDRHVARGFDPQANLAAIDIDNRNADIVVDVDLLTQFSAEHQHFATLLRAMPIDWVRFYCSPRLRKAGIREESFLLITRLNKSKFDTTCMIGSTPDSRTRLNSFKSITF
jgi:hypothetical protein